MTRLASRTRVSSNAWGCRDGHRGQPRGLVARAQRAGQLFDSALAEIVELRVGMRCDAAHLAEFDADLVGDEVADARQSEIVAVRAGDEVLVAITAQRG